MWVDSMVLHSPFQCILDILDWSLQVLFELILGCGGNWGKRWEFIKDVMFCGVDVVVWRQVCYLCRRMQTFGERLTSWKEMTTSSSMLRSTYAQAYSSWTIVFAVELHSSSQTASQKYWSLCHGCKTVHQDWNSDNDEGNRLTHSYLVDFGVISQSIVFVEMDFAKCEWSMKHRREPRVVACGGKVCINVIHGRNHGGQIGCRTRKEKSCILENLRKFE